MCKCCVGKAAVFPVVVQCWHKGDLYRVQQHRAVGSVALPPGGPRVLPGTLRSEASLLNVLVTL